MSAVGYASIPVTLSFSNATREIQSKLKPQLDKLSKDASKSIDKGVGSSAAKAADKVEKANWRVKKSAEELSDAQSKLKAEQSKAKAAALELSLAEQKLADLKESGTASNEELLKAESNLEKKRARAETATQNVEKAERGLEKAMTENARAAESLEKAQSGATDATERFGDAAADADVKGQGFELSLTKVAAAGAVIAGAIGGAAKAAYDIGASFDDAYDTIRVGTGASGAAFEDLQESMRNVARDSIGVGSDMGEIGTTLADLNTRLGVTGEPLEKLTAQFQQLKGMGMEADINAVTGAFQQFGVEVEDMPGMMDRLFQISQATGRGMTDLVANLSKSGPALQEFGFGLEESAGLLGALDKAGLDSEKTLGSMTKALSEFAKEGKNPQEALWGTIQQIEELKRAGDDAGALDLANKIFGARGGAGFVAAVESGQFAYGDFMESLGASSDTISGLAGETADFSEKWDQLKLQAMLAIEPIATAVFDAMVPALESAWDMGERLVEKFKELGEWVQKNSDWLVPLTAGIGAAAAAVGVWQGAIMGWKKATDLAKSAQVAFNAVTKANPVMLIVSAIAALVAGLVVFFTKTETGQKLWKNFTENMSKAWESFTGAFSAGVDWIKEKWEGFTGFFTGAWDGAKDGLANGWESLKERWQSVTDWFKDTTARVSDFIREKFSAVGDAFQSLGDLLQTVYDATVAPVFEVFQNLVGIAKDVITGNFDGISGKFENIAGIIHDTVTSKISAAMDAFKDLVQRMVSAVGEKLGDLVNHFRQLPGKIQNVFSNAASWLVDAGKNIVRGLINGIKSMAGAVGDAVRWVIPDSVERFVPGLHFGGIIPAFATGGVLPDVPGIPRSVRDPILGVDGGGVPVARVEPGEFIVNREDTKKHLPLLHAINSGRLEGEHGDLGLPRYANGGLVSAQELLAFAAGKNVGGKQAPYSLEGAKYNWGGGLLNNWGDCSGAMSGLAAFVVGMALQGRKFATGNEGSVLSSMGFSRGTSSGKNAFEIGFFNGGPYGGHTSGTIYGPDGQATNVEMGGGRGNGQIGGRAAGSRHNQYTDRYWIALKGATEAAIAAGDIESTSVEGVKTKSGKTIDWGTASQLASRWETENSRRTKLRAYTAGIFDTGGIMRHGTAAVNLSGKPERVLDPRTTAAFEQIADHIPGLADAMTQFAGVDWSTIGQELAAAWHNEDFGYGEIAALVGDEWGEKIVDKLSFIGVQVRDMQDGANMRAYLSNMSASEGLGLADRVGGMVGITGIQSTFGGVVKGFEELEDAAIAQVDAAAALTQAEKHLAESRADLAGAGSEDERKAATEAVTAAEKEHSKALGVVKMAAQATGQAQIAMALEVAEMVIGIGKKIWDVVVKITDWINNIRIQTRTAVWELTKSWSELTGVVDQHRGMVSQLQMQLVNAALDVIGKSMEMRTAQVDVVRAQLQGAKNVAEAEAALQAERDKAAGRQKWNFRDMSLEYDRFRQGYRLGMSEQIAGMTHLSEQERERILSTLTGVGQLGDEERVRVFGAVAGMSDLDVREKERITAALAGVGELTVEERARVANAIANMGDLSAEERERIIRAINGVTEVAEEERLRVVAALTGLGRIDGKQQDLTNQIVANVDKEDLAVKLGLDAKLAAQRAADDAYVASVQGREVGERELHQMYKLQLAEQLVGEQAFQNLKAASLDAQLEWQRRVDKAAQLGLESELKARAVVTPEILALQREVYAAEFAQQKSILDAQIKGIEATFAQQQALVSMGRLQEDLIRQQAELDRLSGQTMGMNQGQAIVMEEIARLQAQNAEILGQRNSAAAGARNVLGKAFAWTGDPLGWSKERKQYDAQIAANNKQIAELQKSVYAEGAFTPAQQKQIDEATRLAAKYFAQGNEAAAKAALAASPLGNAQRALEVNKTLSRITDWEAQQRDLQRSQQDALAEFKKNTQVLPLQWRSQEAGSREAAQRYAADALRSDNDGVRDALATLSRLEESNAAELKQLRENPTVVNVTVAGPRDGVTTIGEMEDALVELAGELGATRTTVKRLDESRRTSASDRVRAAIGKY